MNDDGRITSDDIDLLCHAIHAGDAKGDLNGDGVLDDADMDYLVHDILGTTYGDANLDGVFNSADVIQIFAGGEYEDNVPHNSGWAEGDFNCDGEFDSADIIKAMQDGGYVASAKKMRFAAAAADSLFGDEPTFAKRAADGAASELLSPIL